MGFSLNYYDNHGVIDFFELTFDKDEFFKRYNEYLKNLGESKTLTMEDLDKFESKVSDLIEQKENERPYLIRYFMIPNFDDGHFYLYCLAKINNNGITYLFGQSKSALRHAYFSYNEIYFNISKMQMV